MSGKEFKIVLAGEFGSGRTTFISRFNAAKKGKSKVAALKAEIYPLTLHTSAGSVALNVYDSTLHAKGGLNDQGYFRTADACILFFDTTSEASYKNMEKWYDAFMAANSRKGMAPLPVIVAGTKIDDTKGREIQTKDVDWPKKKGLEYREISSKANFGVTELVLDLLKALLGDGTQLTDTVDLATADAKVDEEAAEKAMKEYNEA
ncbi:hypothetical protein NliqN6_6089 [Naganishia liquefaciens]|uniref:Uncharacterized protein n=1 Tax=Naganishia liquefaciens TaxID=104408 RepID=A0A8H3TZ00_9TREE|nr:hypothetical protein NliqN6_6089 [Naganishia liquefaciens]